MRAPWLSALLRPLDGPASSARTVSDARHLPLVFDRAAPVGARARRPPPPAAPPRRYVRRVGRLPVRKLLGVGRLDRRRADVGQADARPARPSPFVVQGQLHGGRRGGEVADLALQLHIGAAAPRRRARGCGSRSGSRPARARSGTDRRKNSSMGMMRVAVGAGRHHLGAAAPAWSPGGRWPGRRGPGCRRPSPGCAPADRRSPPRCRPAADTSARTRSECSSADSRVAPPIFRTAALLADVLQAGDAADVHQVAGGAQPQLQQRQQALPAGEDLGVSARRRGSARSANASSRVWGAW